MKKKTSQKRLYIFELKRHEKKEMPNVILDSRFEDCRLAARIEVWLPQDRISKLLLRFPIYGE